MTTPIIPVTQETAARRALVVYEGNPDAQGGGKLFALDPTNASGVPLPAFRPVVRNPATGSLVGEAIINTTSGLSYVWDGANWIAIVPPSIIPYPTDADVLADSPAAGTYAFSQATGNLFVRYNDGTNNVWREIGIQVFDTQVALKASTGGEGAIAYAKNSQNFFMHDATDWIPFGINRDFENAILASSYPDGTIAYATDTDNAFFKTNGSWESIGIRSALSADLFAAAPRNGSIWFATDLNVMFVRLAGTWQVLGTMRESQNNILNDTIYLDGTRAYATDTGLVWQKINGTWVPDSYLRDTEANILAATPTAGLIAVGTDTGKVWYGDGTNWLGQPFREYPTEAALLADTPANGVLAVALDTGKVHYRVRGAWSGMTTGFDDPIPLGTIAAFPSRTIPLGWLECDGSTLPADPKYDALRALLGGTDLPDLRGEFLRGAKVGDTPLQHHQWTTGRPRTPFTTDITGVHDHEYHSGHNSHSGIKGGDWNPGEVGWNDVANRTDRQGGHQHTIDGGGDAETAPDHTTIVYCIKAFHITVAPTAMRLEYGGTNPQNGEVLTYDTTTNSWVNRAPSGSFNPVITTPTAGQILTYDAANNQWVNTAPPFTPVITTPADGEFLKYDAPNTQWVNAALPQGLQAQSLTQAAYDALGTKDPNTLYLITGP